VVEAPQEAAPAVVEDRPEALALMVTLMRTLAARSRTSERTVGRTRPRGLSMESQSMRAHRKQTPIRIQLTATQIPRAAVLVQVVAALGTDLLQVAVPLPVVVLLPVEAPLLVAALQVHQLEVEAPPSKSNCRQATQSAWQPMSMAMFSRALPHSSRRSSSCATSKMLMSF